MSTTKIIIEYLVKPYSHSFSSGERTRVKFCGHCRQFEVQSLGSPQQSNQRHLTHSPMSINVLYSIVKKKGSATIEVWDIK